MTDLATISAEERILLTGKLFVKYPRILKIFNRIGYCHSKSSRSEEPRCFMVTAEAGCGKTAIAKAYLSKYPRQESESGTIIPVLYASVFVPATVKGVVTGLLGSMGDPFPGHGTVTTMTPKLDRLLVKCGVQIIILDEFHQLIDRQSKSVLYNTADWLKNLIDRTCIPVIVFGLPTAVAILQDHDQLKRRFSARVDLQPFRYETEEEIEEFKTFLTVVDEHLPLPKRSNLSAEYLASRFFQASKGYIWIVMQVIRRATEIAISESHESLTMDLLSRAYEEEIAEDDAEENPFLGDRNELIVTPPEKGKRKSEKKISEILRT